MGNLLNPVAGTSASIAADDATTTFQLAMRILNAALTFLFGYLFGAEFFPTGFPQLSAVLGGVAFAAIYDYGAYGWDAAGKRAGLGTRQMNIARRMSRVAMYASTGLSVAYLLLTSSLINVPDGTKQTVGLIAVIGTGLMLALHFVQIFAYLRAAPEATEAAAQADLRGDMMAFYANQRQKRFEQMKLKVEERMTANVDAFAELEAQREWNKFMADMGYAGATTSNTEGAAAGAKSGVKQQSPPPPPPKDFRDMTDAEKLAQIQKTKEEGAYIDYEELKGNAHVGLTENLNMAGV